MFSNARPATGWRRRSLATIAVAAAATLFGAAALAQAYPTRPIHLIVPAPPAGAADTTARVIARQMEQTLHQPVIVENRAGAAATIGLLATAKAAPDGYTIGLVTIPGIAITGALHPNLALPDLRKDLVTIAGVVNAPHVLVVPASLPVNNAKELIALLKKEPGKHNFASQGEGSLSHLESELFKSTAGVEIQHIPYTGSSLALPGLMTGTTSMMFDSAASVAPHVKAGKLKVLGTSASYRLSQFPDAPTMVELGMTKFKADNPFGFFAPAGTPPAVVKTLSDSVQAALASPQTIEALEKAGLDPRFSSAAEFQKIVAAEMDLWPPIARQAAPQAK
jgi:tripartite-type tricarboxylate transporter receptor subunit TctC